MARGAVDQLLLETTWFRAKRYRPVRTGNVWAVQAAVPFSLENGTPVAKGQWVVQVDGRHTVMDDAAFIAMYYLPGEDEE